MCHFDLLSAQRYVIESVVAMCHLHDLILHSSVAVGGCGSRSGGSGVLIGVGTRLEVIGHLGVKLLGRLLCRTAGALGTGLLAASASSGRATLTGVRVVIVVVVALVVGSRLGLSLGLSVFLLIRILASHGDFAYVVRSARVFLAGGMTLAA